MREISLTRGYRATVDDADFDTVAPYKWRVQLTARNRYAVTGCGKNTRLMHRLILGLRPEDPDVDHRDTNGLNNRRNNMRLASPSLNQQNARKRTTSRYKGVTWGGRIPRLLKQWQAHIHISGKGGSKKLLLGSFSRAIDAARAYDAAARSYFGQFARTNFAE